MSKKWLVCVWIGVFFYLGCSSPNKTQLTWTEENGKLKVLSTLPMINDLVKQIGEDKIDSISLIQGELDPHSYELVKGDDEKFARADLIFYNGLGLEHGLSLRNHLENNPKSIALGDWIYQQSPKLILFVEGKPDPHVWMDISLWMRLIDPIVNQLSEKAPAYQAFFKEKGELLKSKMREADEKSYAVLQAIPSEKRYLVTSHDAFHYFTRRYLAEPNELNTSSWQCRCAAPEGLAPDAQLSLTDIQYIISHVKKYQITVLFPEANVSKDSLRKILDAGKKMNCDIRLCSEILYADSMSDKGYLATIEHNVNTIARELGGAP